MNLLQKEERIDCGLMRCVKEYEEVYGCYRMPSCDGERVRRNANNSFSAEQHFSARKSALEPPRERFCSLLGEGFVDFPRFLSVKLHF